MKQDAEDRDERLDDSDETWFWFDKPRRDSRRPSQRPTLRPSQPDIDDAVADGWFLDV